MDHAIGRRIWILCIFFAFLLFLTACGGGDAEASAADGSSEPAATETADAVSSEDSEGSYEPPEMRTASFHEDTAEGNDEVLVDLSRKDKGFFSLYCTSEKKIKLQVFKDDETYTYDVEKNKEQVFPFQLGNGSYTIKVMRNIEGTKYMELYVTSAEVNMKDEFDPFLRPSQYADYDADSKCVAKAKELASQSSDQNDFISNVYKYVTESVTYDKEKAANLQPGYIPVPDEIFESGKGICFDYASLATCMLRSQGVPTKIIFGYVGEDGDLYHAWNMYYTEEAGWVAVEFEVSEDEWNRLDLTFSANGADSQYIGDGSNYLDVYQF